MKDKIYQGSSKILYQSAEDFSLIMSFTDQITLENGNSFNISGKGVINNTISAYIMHKLDMLGIENHLIEKINMREQQVQFVDIFPVKVVISNIACGRFTKEFGMDEGYVFDEPIIDFRVKNKEFKHPVINEQQMISFGWLTKREIEGIQRNTVRVFDFLTGLFAGAGIRLVECTLEFGRVFNSEEFIIMLADEITPDNCRLWDMHTNEKLSFEAIEKDPANSGKIYANILRRLNILPENL